MLSPVDIQNKEFKKAKFSGYNMEEVNDFLDEIIDSYHHLTKENHELKDKMNMLNENIQYYRAMEATIQNALVLAEKTAQDTKALAYEKADQIKADAEQKAAGIVERAKQELYTLQSQVEELRKQHTSFKIQISKVLQGQLEILEQYDVAKISENIAIPEEKGPIQEVLEVEEEVNLAVEEAAVSEDVFYPTDDLYYTREYDIVHEDVK